MDRSLTDPIAEFQYLVLRAPRPLSGTLELWTFLNLTTCRGPTGSDCDLRALGADDDLIGDCLGMDPAGVSTLIEIGRRKLASEKRPAKQIGLPDADPDSGPPATGD